MSICKICGRGSPVCVQCNNIKNELAYFSPAELICVVDGSYNDRDGSSGGGIVFANRIEQVIVAVPVTPGSTDSNLCELDAIERALLLKPGVTVWSDNHLAVDMVNCSRLTTTERFSEFQPVARIIPGVWRNGLHTLAHQVANLARNKNWRYYEKLMKLHRSAA